MIQYRVDNAWRIYCCCLLALALCSLTAAHAADTSIPSTSNAPNYVHCSEMTCLLHWSRFPVRLFFSVTPYATSDRRALALSGFDEWIHAASGVVCYQIVKDEKQADIIVRIVTSVDMPKEAEVIGQTTVTYNNTTLSKAVIQVVVRDAEPAEFQEVCAHEFGHALGINGHSDDPDDMMFPVLLHPLSQVSDDEQDFLNAPSIVTKRDINTLKAAYPTLTFPSKNH